MKNCFELMLPRLYKQGILPVFCPKTETELDTFLDAVAHSPLTAVEITLRSEVAVGAIEKIKNRVPSLFVGAGTVLSEDILEIAVSAGADFLVAPGYSMPLLDKAKEKGMDFLPGCSTPTEIQNAGIRGFSTVKYFPAEQSGGVSALTLYRGAFAGTSFIPTGGITLSNLSSYLALDNVLACGGSFMLPKDMMKKGDSEGIYNTIMECLRIRGGQDE
ncbi:MAG: bifunctional 4-hydroxy-2-oxoglutarate aldolase/2-dehydro-3-deoxy-phosphogluconate aldolase [Clostridia bacterium]|nr:bifunctional 4-hydroxy-2-oxoglutarate aldolase/2-dehydro-3-deoxy-phosphogluconate aldolase [Clostridia bacterium]